MGKFPENPIEKSSDEERDKKNLFAKITGLYGKEIVELAISTGIMAHDELIYPDNVDDINKLLERFKIEIDKSNPGRFAHIENQLNQIMAKAQKEKEERKSKFGNLFKK